MPGYVLFFYESPTATDDLSPEEIQTIIQKYSAWADDLEKKGRYLAGNKLKDGEGRVMRGSGGDPRVLDGPYSETKEIIGGFIAISAADYDDAVSVARTCPHLAYGGTIEIRQIEETG